MVSLSDIQRFYTLRDFVLSLDVGLTYVHTKQMHRPVALVVGLIASPEGTQMEPLACVNAAETSYASKSAWEDAVMSRLNRFCSLLPEPTVEVRFGPVNYAHRECVRIRLSLPAMKGSLPVQSELVLPWGNPFELFTVPNEVMTPYGMLSCHN